jgi:transcriptional regulator with XRE-family HTH domain
MSITTAQIRGARGILNWSQSDLAERTGISATSIGSIENGQSTPRANTLNTIQKTFEDAGIEFIGREGVRVRTGDVRVYQGREGFKRFFDVVFEAVKRDGGQILVSNVEERKFLKWAGDSADEHMKRMAGVKDLHMKVLLREGDFDFAASDYVEYRWLPKNLFTSVPFYAFSDSLAIMLLDNEPTIVVLNYSAVAEAYRIQFAAMWETAMTPDMSKKPMKRSVNG